MNSTRPSAGDRFLIEPLEARIAPASLLSFTDVDGDHVKITVSKGTLTAGGNVTLFDGVSGGKLLQEIDLSDPSFSGASLTVAVTKVTGGDGQVVVDDIYGGSNNLTNVTVAGDVGNIDCGSGSGMALKKFTIASLGRFEQRGPGDLVSGISGDAGSVTIKGDLENSYFRVAGNLKSITVGGSVIGGDTGDTGEIYAEGTIGSVVIKHDLRGGAGTFSGSVGAGVSVDSVTMGGSIYGAKGNDSGIVYGAYLAAGTLGKVSVVGSVVGGSGTFSGAIGVSLNALALSLGTVTIGHDLIGGSGPHSGSIQAFAESAQKIVIKGSIRGGDGPFSGSAGASFNVESITVGGSLFGGSTDHTGYLFGANMGDGHLTTVLVKGSLLGGGGTESGAIGGDVNNGATFYSLDFGTVTVNGDVIGGAGTRSGSVDAFYGHADHIGVGGSVIGGSGGITAYLAAHDAIAITVNGSIYGGVTAYDGSIFVQGSASQITIRGSVFGGVGQYTGIVEIDGGLGTLTLRGDLRGGSGANSGYIVATPGITKQVIGGAIIPGAGTGSGTIVG